MIQHIVLGGGLAFAAGVQPGPLQAFIISRAIEHGLRRTLPVALSPLLSDGPIAVLVILALGRLPLEAQQLLRGIGGLFLVFLAWSGFRRLSQPPAAVNNDHAPTFHTLYQAVLVNLLNPNPYLAWALVLGPAVVNAWRLSRSNAFALIIAFYGTMAVMLGVTVTLAASARSLSPRNQRGIGFISALVLLGLGLYQIIVSITA